MNKKNLVLGLYLIAFMGFTGIVQTKARMIEDTLNFSFQACCQDNTFYLIKEKRPVVKFQDFMDQFTSTLHEYPSCHLIDTKLESSPNYAYPVYAYLINQKFKITFGLYEDVFTLKMNLKEK